MAYDFDQGGGLGDFLGGIGGAIGGIFGGGDEERRQAADLYHRAVQEYAGLDPSIRAERESAVNLGPSAMEGVASQVDPTGRNMQLQALQSIMESGLSGGMDAQSRARMAQAQAQSAQQERAARQSLQQQAQARGMGTGMSSYAAQLANQQGAAQRLGQEGVQAAGDANARALQAFAQGGSLAGHLRAGDYGQAADRARAADVINAYNARNQQDVAARNIDRGMQAHQQTFNNRLGQANATNSARYQQARNFEDEAQRQRQRGAGIGEAAGRGIGMAGGFL